MYIYISTLKSIIILHSHLLNPLLLPLHLNPQHLHSLEASMLVYRPAHRAREQRDAQPLLLSQLNAPIQKRGSGAAALVRRQRGQGAKVQVTILEDGHKMLAAVVCYSIVKCPLPLLIDIAAIGTVERMDQKRCRRSVFCTHTSSARHLEYTGKRWFTAIDHTYPQQQPQQSHSALSTR